MTAATVSYYTDTVARGVEDYYAGRGEAEGRWIGSGALAAGLEGTVTGDQLAALFGDRHPLTGEPLGAAYVVRDGADRVAGWDLTFSAPKSVSVLWAVGGGAVGIEAREAHDAAVRSALDYLAEHAAFSRAGKAGVRQVDTDGLVAAAFVHRTSRSGDPQLHTHVLVSNRVRCADGVWRALDSKALHRQLKATGMLYHAALRSELTARLGVAWSTPDRHGQAEVRGVPAGLRRAFSSRRAAVEADAADRIAAREAEVGRQLTPTERRRLFETATLATRAAKTMTAGVSDVGLHDRWQLEAEAAGYPTVSWIRDTVDRASPILETAPDVSHIRDIVTQLSVDASTWTRADVVKLAARHAPLLADGKAVRAWIETTADRVVAHEAVIDLTPATLDSPGALRRRDGRSVFDRHDAPRYTTAQTLAVEQHVLDTVAAGRDAGVAVADRRDVRRAITVGGLDGDQAAAVHTVTSDGDAVSVVVGPAGTGKTRMLAAAADAWAASAIPVRGLTVSAMAAGVLAAETGIRADTIAKFLHEHDRPDGPGSGWRLADGEVVVVDEAGMASTADLARVIDLADAAGGKVVLVGDPAQLGPVEAGGLFRLLAADPSAELGTVRRFAHDWERDASLRLRHGDRTVIDVYDRQGRIVGGDRAAVLDEAVAGWHASRDRGESVVITAADHATVARLAERIQADRVAAGHVQPDGVIVSAGQMVGAGDEIVTLRNDRRLVTSSGGWVRNGDRWTVTSLGEDGSMAVARLDGRGDVELPAAYVDNEVALAYAVTVHKAQGVTVDRAIAVVDERTTAEGLYVAMTRGRQSNVALAVTDSFDADHHHRRPALQEPADVLAAAMARASVELSATETRQRHQARAASLAELKPRLAQVEAHIRRDCPPDHSIDVQRAAGQLAHAQEQRRPGWLTPAGRDDRRALDALQQRVEQFQTAQQQRESWLAANRDLLDYRDHLAAQVDSRVRDLGRRAVNEQPAHLTALLGDIPCDSTGRARWQIDAARVEAYREEWGVPADRLDERPADRVQLAAWQDAVASTLRTRQLAQQREQRLARLIEQAPQLAIDRSATRSADRSVDRGVDLGW